MWDPLRTPTGFGDNASFEDARADIDVEFPGTTYKRLVELSDESLCDVDMLILDAFSAGPFPATELAALEQFVLDGGTLFAHVGMTSFCAEMTFVNDFVSPFGLTIPCVFTSPCQNHGVAFIPGDPIVDGAFCSVVDFENCAETGRIDGGGMVLAADSFGPVLVYFPSGSLGAGRAVFHLNYHAFADATDIPPRFGRYRGANDNECLLLNSVASAVAGPAPPCAVSSR